MTLRNQKTNKIKHGNDFVVVQMVWEDFNLLKIPAKITDELRSLVIGKISNKYWSAVITYLYDNIRIISVCRSVDEEIVLYES